jgi:hypothetical protein
MLLMVPHYPPDDYWRHLKAHHVGYNYQNLFLDPHVPSKDFYLGFDYILSLLEPVFGIYAFIPIQLLILSLYSLGLYWALKDSHSKELATILFIVSLSVVFSRVVLARPTVLVSSLFVFLWFVRIKDEIKPFLMAMATPLYWLTFLYCFVFTFRTPLFGLLSVLLSFFILFFMYGGDVFMEVMRIFHYQSFRVEGLSVLENENPLVLIATPSVFALLGLSEFRKDLRTFFAGVLFLLSFQVRYAIEVSLMFFASFSRYLKVSIPPLLSVPFLYMIFAYSHQVIPLYDYREVRGIFQNKKVLFGVYGAPFFQAVYFLDAKFSPSMEVGYSSKDVQRLLLKDFSCSRIKGYDLFVENWLTYEPECLELVGVYKEFRIWKIR